MTEPYDDVSKIHKRYSLTLLTPSSKYHSLIFSGIIAAITGYLILTTYLERQSTHISPADPNGSSINNTENRRKANSK